MNNEMPGTAGHSFHSFTVRFYIYQPISHIKRNERDLISLALYSRTILLTSNCHLRSIDLVNLSEPDICGSITRHTPVTAWRQRNTADFRSVRQARALYSKMKHYAELTDNENFASCFETAMDADTLQNQMKSVSQAEAETKDLTGHEDVCFLDPTEDKTQSPYYFGVGLTDYEVEKDGSVQWYSVLIRIAKYKDGWKAAALPEGNFFSGKYPEGYEAALGSGRNAVDLYPYLALRFSEKGVFDGAFYSLVNMAWQNTDGSLGLALWLANGQEETKWCDSIDLVLTDGTKQVASVNTPVQQAVEGGQSMLVTVNIPAANVKTGTDKWSSLSVSSNLLYQ